ncbi:cupin domain-containing protein [Halosimplex marinum]|uniref:cupin domain-containing protein n=1 Tax=Halosimplex marinum TaxID=3396620 RepID=UPI003F56D1ED
MGYHVVDPDGLEPEPDRPSEMRYVSEAAGLERLGLRTYAVEPGEEIPLSGMHYHDEQEEAFYVISGTLSVETPEETYRVEADQFFVAEPGSPHRAHVAGDADGPARVVGIGAPPVSDGHTFEGE